MKHRICSALAVAVLVLPFAASAQQTGTHIKKIDKVIVHPTIATDKGEASVNADKELRAMPALPVIVEEAADQPTTSSTIDSTQAE
jgi:hypothetical protein